MRYSLCLVVVGLLATSASLRAQNGNFVPGSGTLLEKVGDDFEDPNWDYVFNEPKSSEELNERQNLPWVNRPMVDGTKAQSAASPMWFGAWKHPKVVCQAALDR